MRVSLEILKQYRKTYQEACPQSSPNDFDSTLGRYKMTWSGLKEIRLQQLTQTIVNCFSGGILDPAKPNSGKIAIDQIAQEQFFSWLKNQNCPPPPPDGALTNQQLKIVQQVLREFFPFQVQRVVVNAVFTGTTRFITRGGPLICRPILSSMIVGTLGGIFLGGLGEGLRQFSEHGEVISGQLIAEKMVTGAIEGFAVGLGVGIASKVFSRFPRSNQLKQVTIPVAKQLPKAA